MPTIITTAISILRLLIIQIMLFSYCSGPASVPVTWQSSNYFVTCNTLIMAERFAFVPSSSGPITDTGTYTYATPLTAVPTRGVIFGIVNLDLQVTNPDLILSIINTNRYQTGFDYSVDSNNGTYISTLLLSFLTVDPSFTQPFSITYFSPVIFT